MSDWLVKFEAAGQPCAPKTVATMSLCPLRDGDHRRRLLTMANRWGREDTVEVSASEERWISHVNATTCAQIDQTRISRDLTLGAETHVLDPQTVYEARLLVVVGASGIGKSSVVHAGLFPRLRQTKAGRVWEIATLVPTDRPLHSLAAALVPILEPKITRVDRLAEINKLAGYLAEGTVALRDVAADVLRTQPGTDRLLLFVDQWEELYTLVADDSARRRFLAEILDASEKGPVTVVLTLRGDFFGQALSDRSFADRLQGAQVNLGPGPRRLASSRSLRPRQQPLPGPAATNF